uniref:Uncharacterized protein n=1 Tax=Tanacetum cinerariifolium TaxID=118510 RepID=A0A699RKL2_TANCI|nr:hypothetical protein [Tanacetum cinerariifolium]
MAIDGVGWDWSYMANEEDHALVADGETPTEFAKECRKNTKRLNDKIDELKNDLYEANVYRHSYKLGIDQLERRLAECKDREEEKDVVDGKLARLLKSLKDLEDIIESQRSKKVKEGVGYNAVPLPAADLYLSPKKDLS